MNAQKLILGLLIVVAGQQVAAVSFENTLPDGDPGLQAFAATKFAEANATSGANNQDKVNTDCSQNVGVSSESGDQTVIVGGDIINLCK